MTDINRRKFIKHSVALAGAASAAGGISSEAAALLSPKPSFPSDVAPWHTGSVGDLPRIGVRAPEGFDYPVRTNLPFAHGVASGDPLADRVIIWTRLTLVGYLSRQLEGEWRLATDPHMQDIVQTGSFVTSADQDWTVKIDVEDLLPYQTYYYQFFYNGAESIVGRTRTAPAPGQETGSIRMAVAACASYYSGYMNGYGRLADRTDIDFIAHCGDYVYDFPDGEEKIRIPNGQDSNANIDFRRPLNLDEARRRFALYRSDPDLFRAHQQHPFVIIWDNHDVLLSGVPKEDSYQAYWEWTPSRRPDANDLFRGHRAFQYGQLADVIAIDRHYADRYPDTEKVVPEQAFLGVSQNQWLRDRLLESQARDAQWRLIINQVFLAQLHAINPPSSLDWVLGKLFPDYQDGIILNSAQWDGYPQEREDLFKFLRNEGIDNNIVVTGDMHMNWASDLNEDPNSPLNYDPTSGRGSVGVEFAPSSISRGGADETIAGALSQSQMTPASRFAGKVISRIAERAILTTNANGRFMEWVEHGYGIVDVSSQKAVFEFWWTPILEQTNEQRLGKQMVCYKGNNHMESTAITLPTSRNNSTDLPLAPEANEELLYQTV